MSGSISDRETVHRAMADVSHVVHLATVKEDPALVMDVAIKGMFWMLEEFRLSPSARQFILVGGDAAVGHCFIPHADPVTETTPRAAYPGVYALSKVIEEVMLEQYNYQYGINFTTLRASWIMEKDDLKFALSFGADQFGGPNWDTLVTPSDRQEFASEQLVPLLLDCSNNPLRRNIVHLDDLVDIMINVIDNDRAFGELFNVTMTTPLDYSEVSRLLHTNFGLRSIAIKTPFHSNSFSNAKAQRVLNWKPKYDLRRMVVEGFDYLRAADDPRKIWYVG